MADDTNDFDRIEHGSELMRRVYSHFGIRSARAERERQANDE